jgi:hypothetical protein
MRILIVVALSLLLYGCSNGIETQQPNTIQNQSVNLLPAKWTETTTPTVTFSPTHIIIETNTPTTTKTYTPTNSSSRYYETAYTPNYSYIPPLGWQKVYKTSSNQKSKEAASWTTKNHQCTLNFLMIAAGSITSKEFLENQMNQAKPMIILSEGIFPNASSLDTYRVIVQFTIDGPNIFYYAFHQGYFVLNGTYSCGGKNNNENDGLIEQTMESVQFEK